jgi:tetratricopeptide (TPR) repeat protein
MTNPHAERTRVLLELKRYADAEKEVVQALGIEPNASHLHAWLAVCLLARGAVREAEAAAGAAIAADPESSFAYYTAARVAHKREQKEKALQLVHEALRLAPYDADYHYFLAAVHYDYGRRSEALRAADEGLRHDPLHVQCANLRALCLAHFGDSVRAAATLEQALANDPEYYWSHENRGKLAAGEGDVEKALAHYREALRLNPQSEEARSGLVHSLKSRNRAYRFLFWLFDWSDERHGSRRLGVAAVAVLLLALVLSRGMEPAGAIIAALFIVTGGVFAARIFFRHFADPFFVCLLRFDQLGRRALSADEVRRANLAVGSLVAACGLLVTGIVFRMPLVGFAALPAILCPFPLHFIFRQPPGGLRLWATLDYLGFMLVMAFLLLLSFALPILGFLWCIHGVAAVYRLISRRAEYRRAMARL